MNRIKWMLIGVLTCLVVGTLWGCGGKCSRCMWTGDVICAGVAGGTSDACNTAVFNIFALVDIGERSGMGLANLHGLWKKYGYAEPEITEFHDQGRIVIVVTTDDDTVNDTVTRPENGFETDQNPIRSAPEVGNKVDDTAEGDNKTGSVGDNNSFRGDNKYEQRRPFAELITPLYLTDFGTGTKLLVARYGHE